MTLTQRIDLLQELRKYLERNDAEWQEVKFLATQQNAWFTPQMIEHALSNIISRFLCREHLLSWARQYEVPENQEVKKTVGLVMAGNLPLVGFHDWLSVFITGHYSLVKPSSKDNVLLRKMILYLYELTPLIQDFTGFAEQLKNCDAYIATGSTNSSRYFEYYFSKYPSVIRTNKTSVAILDGTETELELDLLARDISLYFGMGCRSVTQLYVPEAYPFEPLVMALRKYESYLDHNKMKNNFDYQLALLMMNSQPYMSGGPVILVESKALFAPVSVVNWHHYSGKKELMQTLSANSGIQCIVGHDFIPFGEAQSPSLTEYADGTDTMKFLQSLGA